VGDGGFTVASAHQYSDPTDTHHHLRFGLFSATADCTGSPLDGGRFDDLVFEFDLSPSDLGPGSYTTPSDALPDGGTLGVYCERDWQDGIQGGGDYPSGTVTVSQIEPDGTIHGSFDLQIGTNANGFAGPLTGTFSAPPCSCP
jgi:hypothetical protein